MKKDEFIKVINQIIESKIKKIVPELVNEELKKFKKQNGDNILKSNNSNEKEILPFNKMPTESSNTNIKSSPKKVYSNNKAINTIMQQIESEVKNIGQDADSRQRSILSEARVILEEQYKNGQISEEDIKTLNFSTNDVDVVNNPILQKAGQDILKKEIINQSGNPELANILVKDYRELLKKSKEIKNKGI